MQNLPTYSHEKLESKKEDRIMILTIAALVTVLGALIYAFATNPKMTELGRIMFFAGLLCVLLNVGGVVGLLPVRGR
jgi:uncharacterized membrane protein